MVAHSEVMMTFALLDSCISLSVKALASLWVG